MQRTELGDMLDLTTAAIDSADVEPGQGGDELMRSVDRLLAAGLQLQAHLENDPGATVDRHGRCHQCGRLLAFPPRPRIQASSKRGCLFLPATVAAHLSWLVNPAMSIPALGKALWLWRRRSA